MIKFAIILKIIYFYKIIIYEKINNRFLNFKILYFKIILNSKKMFI